VNLDHVLADQETPKNNSLAYAELYLALAGVFRNFHFELHDTDESNVALAHDFFLPSPKLDSKGVRVRCVADSSSSGSVP
jgi:hypothetical protein